MTTLTTAVQVRARNDVADDKRLAFDVEFNRQRVRTWMYVLLMCFLGNLGAHRLYLFLKEKQADIEVGFGTAVFVFFMFGFWVHFLGEADPERSAVAFVMLQILAYGNGVWTLATGRIRSVNDRIAKRVSVLVK